MDGMNRQRRCQRGRSGSDGFTLVEMLVALTVFAIGMLSLSAMLLTALEGENRGRHTTQAAAIAESRMERLQRQSWTALAPTTGWETPVTEQNIVQSGSDQVEQDYTVDWRITDLVANWTRTIDVRIRWSEPKRPNRSLVITGVRFNRDAV